MYNLVRWGRMKPGMAAALMALGLLGELIIAGVATSLTGLGTPGS
jgi:hypothetical protein